MIFFEIYYHSGTADAAQTLLDQTDGAELFFSTIYGGTQPTNIKTGKHKTYLIQKGTS